MTKSNRLGKISIWSHHMRFIEKTDYNLSISNSSVNALNAYKIKSIFLLSLDFAADSSRYI